MVVFPTDHFVYPEKSFQACVRSALNACKKIWEDNKGVLLGAKPRKAREGISWIIPDEFARFSEENPIHDVARFVEKPGSKHAAKLLL